jgi:hypothetical protein
MLPLRVPGRSCRCWERRTQERGETPMPLTLLNGRSAAMRQEKGCGGGPSLVESCIADAVLAAHLTGRKSGGVLRQNLDDLLFNKSALALRLPKERTLPKMAQKNALLPVASRAI